MTYFIFLIKGTKTGLKKFNNQEDVLNFINQNKDWTLKCIIKGEELEFKTKLVLIEQERKPEILKVDSVKGSYVMEF